MTQQNTSYNCIVCAGEFDSEDMQNVILSEINTTKFKICELCLNMSDPKDDYSEAKSIVNSYVKITEAKNCFKEANEILFEIKNKL